MTWVIAIAGFCGLIVAHELGHFAAAKAVGMRVERFSLFFPPKLLGFRVGETEYQLGALPLGGYVKITGMTPDELEGVDPGVAERSYYMKAPWKRIVVIVAGPAVNLILALVLFAAVLMSGGLRGEIALGNLAPSQSTVNAVPTTGVEAIVKGGGAWGKLALGDRIVAIAGRPVSASDIDRALQSVHCRGPQVTGCAATAPVAVTVIRKGARRTFELTPHYDATVRRMVIGIELDAVVTGKRFGIFGAIGTSAAALWDTGTSTVTNYFDALTSSKVRRQLQSVAGIAEDTEQAVAVGPSFALVVLGLVSLVLAVVNLFPFLPLDGGHVVWSLAEKLRGKRVSIAAMWRYSSVGIVLLAFLVINGISNDISRLSG